MKRLLSICLAIAMLFSMPATAFAQGIIPTADKTLVKKGEQVVVTTPHGGTGSWKNFRCSRG